MNTTSTRVTKVAETPPGIENLRFSFFSLLLKKPVCAGKITDKIGKLSDLVFLIKEPYPEAVGIYMEYGWGKPTKFIPWERVLRLEDDAIFVKPEEEGHQYGPFIDQPNWIMLDNHLMGRTVLDMDGRRIEVVNDIHLVESKGRLLLMHVDTSFNGFLRRWGLTGLHWLKDNFISWRFVQPLSVEDSKTTDRFSLSVTRKQLKELPSEDLADALEELSGKEQQALFSALDSEKAAETLIEAEPRAQRQLVAKLRKERARMILGELTVPQLANLFSVLPHDDVVELLEMLPKEQSERIRSILSEREATAVALMTSDYLSTRAETTVGKMLAELRHSNKEPQTISYIYVVNGDGKTLMGVVDLRELVLADDDKPLSELMTAPVVSAEENDVQEDLAEIFAKYHYRMIPVLDANDKILGVIRYADIMKGLVTRAKD
jgi:magnesium transporter